MLSMARKEGWIIESLNFESGCLSGVSWKVHAPFSWGESSWEPTYPDIKVRTGYRSKDIRRTMVSMVKDKTDLDSWFSAKPIKVGNLSNIFAGTELNLRQDVLNFIISYYYEIDILLCTYRGVVETLSVSM